MKTINTVSIIGHGALGMLYGKFIQEGIGFDNTSFIMDRNRYERNIHTEFICNGEKAEYHFVPVDEAKPADLVIVAVKSPSMDSALETMAPCVGDNTIIMSVMNGIASEGILAEKFGSEKLIYTVAQGMDSGKIGNELKYTKIGELHLGLSEDGQQDNLDAVAELLGKSNLDYVFEDDIMFRMWSKFMLNVGVNQTCMVYDTTYGDIIAVDEYYRTFIAAMREVVAVANAEGVHLRESDINFYENIIRTLNKDLMPSMAQDRINKKPCEVEAFSGTVMKLAKKHNILVPTNEFLNRRAKEIESEYV